MIKRVSMFGISMILLVGILTLLFISTLPIVSSSSGETFIDIAGCRIPDTNIYLLPGHCSTTREHFCPDGTTGLVFANNTDDYCTPGCCPTGKTCNSNNRCEISTVDCSNYTNRGECLDAGDADGVCFWIETGNEENDFCTDNQWDQSCSIYETNITCEDDQYGVGQNGLGTEVCGQYSLLGRTITNCRCIWTTDENCSLAYNSGETIYSGDRDAFDCLKTFTNGDCINGRQNISWTATSSIISGYENNQPITQAELNDANCVADSKTRVCGSARIRLPGFSTYAIIAVVLAIAIYYIY